VISHCTCLCGKTVRHARIMISEEATAAVRLTARLIRPLIVYETTAVLTIVDMLCSVSSTS